MRSPTIDLPRTVKRSTGDGAPQGQICQSLVLVGGFARITRDLTRENARSTGDYRTVALCGVPNPLKVASCSLPERDRDRGRGNLLQESGKHAVTHCACDCERGESSECTRSTSGTGASFPDKRRAFPKRRLLIAAPRDIADGQFVPEEGVAQALAGRFSGQRGFLIGLVRILLAQKRAARLSYMHPCARSEERVRVCRGRQRLHLGSAAESSRSE